MTAAATDLPIASPAYAGAHFAAELNFQVDCWDVHDALSTGSQDLFPLLDVRRAEPFAKSYAPGAVNLPRGTASRLSHWPEETLALRACITGFETDKEGIDVLIALLERVRT